MLKSAKPPDQRHITPPLLPASPPLSPLCLPSVIEHVDLTSSPEPLIAIEAAELDRQIMARDDHTVDRAHDRADISSPVLDEIRYFSNIDSACGVVSSPSRGNEVHGYKAEVPLLPLSAYDSSPSPVQAASFPASLMSLFPVAEGDIIMQAAENPTEDIDTFMERVVAPLAEPTIIRIEEERLIELDTTMRVDVPNVHTSTLKPPWTTFIEADASTSMLDAQRTLLRLLRREHMKDIRRWGGLSKLDKILPWCAFPTRIGRIDVDEMFDDGSGNQYMDDLLADMTQDVKLFIPSIDGLHLLDETALDDHELECANFDDEDGPPPEPVSWLGPTVSKYGQEQYQPQVSHYFRKTDKTVFSACARRRHSPLSPQPVQGPKTRTLPPAATPELSESLPDAPGSSTCGNENICADDTITNPSTQPSMRTLLAKRKRELEAFQPIKTSNFDLAQPCLDAHLPGSMGILHNCSTGSALANFIRVQGGQVDCLAEETRQHIPAVSATRPIATSTVSTDRLPESTCAPLPIPEVIGSNLHGQIVFSPLVFANRAIVRGMQSMFPNVEPIERSDLTMDNGKHSTTQSVVHHADADMTLSPSTGLSLTTLQTLKQKPLPGQTSFHGIREQISSVAGRYETLIVLVEDARPVPMLDDNDTDALCDFIGFTLSLPTAVQVFYVADSLQAWLAGVISQHVLPTTPETKLLPDETTWERFLREAGMNAFAAQVVLNQLKKSDVPGAGSDDSARDGNSALYGLAAFLRMSGDLRIRRFGMVLGGHRVLAQPYIIINLLRRCPRCYRHPHLNLVVARVSIARSVWYFLAASILTLVDRHLHAQHVLSGIWFMSYGRPRPTFDVRRPMHDDAASGQLQSCDLKVLLPAADDLPPTSRRTHGGRYQVRHDGTFISLALATVVVAVAQVCRGIGLAAAALDVNSDDADGDDTAGGEIKEEVEELQSYCIWREGRRTACTVRLW
nr:hypothetical protein CFP56_12077 [Quercus suber]